MILNGWKEIASYVNSSVRTVQRWEKAGMPVVRPLPSLRGSVIAYSEQLDSWLGRPRSETQLSALQGGTPRRENLLENLLQARTLRAEIRATKIEMEGNMNLLKSEVSLLRENLIRMKLASSLYTVAQRLTSVVPKSLVLIASEQQRRSA
jgi:phage terminase Nu1 subunit (DNA packaging protein)